MTSGYQRESYGYLKTNHSLKVDYAFVRTGMSAEERLSGRAQYFGKNSFILQAELPKLSMVQELLTHKLKVEVYLHIPNEILPIKAVTRTSWIETIDPVSYKCKIGLTFETIDEDVKGKLYNFVISEQMN